MATGFTFVNYYDAFGSSQIPWVDGMLGGGGGREIPASLFSELEYNIHHVPLSAFISSGRWRDQARFLSRHSYVLIYSCFCYVVIITLLLSLLSLSSPLQ